MRASRSGTEQGGGVQVKCAAGMRASRSGTEQDGVVQVKCTVGMRGSRPDTDQDRGIIGNACLWTGS